MAQIFLRVATPDANRNDVLNVSVPNEWNDAQIHGAMQSKGYKVLGRVEGMNPNDPLIPQMQRVDFASPNPQAQVAQTFQASQPSVDAAASPVLQPDMRSLDRTPGRTPVSEALPTVGAVLGSEYGLPGQLAGTLIGSVAGHGYQNYFEPNRPSIGLGERILKDEAATLAGYGLEKFIPGISRLSGKAAEKVGQLAAPYVGKYGVAGMPIDLAEGALRQGGRFLKYAPQRKFTAGIPGLSQGIGIPLLSQTLVRQPSQQPGFTPIEPGTTGLFTPNQ